MLLNHPEIRHTCEQSDSLTSYAYTQHDGRTYSSQDLVDEKNNAKITTKFLKSERGGEGSDGWNGDGWVVRVRGEVIDPSKPSVHYHQYTVLYTMRSALSFELLSCGSVEVEDVQLK